MRSRHPTFALPSSRIRFERPVRMPMHRGFVFSYSSDILIGDQKRQKCDSRARWLRRADGAADVYPNRLVFRTSLGLGKSTVSHKLHVSLGGTSYHTRFDRTSIWPSCTSLGPPPRLVYLFPSNFLPPPLPISTSSSFRTVLWSQRPRRV